MQSSGMNEEFIATAHPDLIKSYAWSTLVLDAAVNGKDEKWLRFQLLLWVNMKVDTVKARVLEKTLAFKYALNLEISIKDIAKEAHL